MKIEKLYTAISFMDFDNRNGIVVHWYHGERNLQWSNIDYSKLIENYNDMNGGEKSMSKTYVNQFFTSEEIDLLRDYLLQEEDTGLFTSEISLPVKTYFEDENGEKRFFFSLHKFEEYDNTIDLDYNEEIGLHFSVTGLYDPGDGFPMKTLHRSYVFHGLAFVRNILESLKYRKKWSDSKLTEIVKSIYQKDGLYANFNIDSVERDKDPEEVT